MTKPICYLCGGQEVIPFSLGRASELYVRTRDLIQCTQCRLVFTAIRPEVSDLASQYDATYYSDVLGSTCASQSSTLIARYFGPLLDQIGLYRRSGQLLDIGCATGDFLIAARDRGWTVTGIEVSEYAARQARSRGLNVLAGPLARAEKNLGIYDVISMWEVLEHLTDPLDELERVRAHLAPKGILAISTPNVYGLSTYIFGRRSVTFKPNEHLFYFSRETFARILETAGFRILFLKTHLLLLSNFLVAWQRGKAGPDELQAEVHLSVRQKKVHNSLLSLAYGTGLGTIGVAAANHILGWSGLGDGLVAFAESMD